MRIGDLVREYVGGSVMQIVGWLEGGLAALCRVLTTGRFKRVVAESLIGVGMMYGAAHGHPPEDPPGHPVIGKPAAAITIAASGGTVKAFGLDDEAGAPQAQTTTWGLAPGWHAWQGRMVRGGGEAFPFSGSSS